MTAFAYYILKVVIISAVLFGYYRLLLRDKVFHGYNRFYLLGTVVLSLLLPLIRIDIFTTTKHAQPAVINMLRVVTTGDEYMNDMITEARRQSMTVTEILSVVYISVSVCFMLLLLQMLFRIGMMIRRYKSRVIGDIRFVNTVNEPGTPFSFFRYIFWNSETDMRSNTGNRIFKHELAHIRERHSHDKLFINIVLALFWSNPVFWLIRRELNMIHEFIADKQAVENGDTAAFAAMILEAAYPHQRMHITNHFFYSPIKRRLMMLTKNQDPKINYLSRLMVLPVAIIVFAAFTLKATVPNGAIKNGAIPKLSALLAAPPLSTGLRTATTPAGIFHTNKAITVVIDAGHGGEDKGAVNVSGTLTEKDLTLLLAKKIKELNKNTNIIILLTRELDTYSAPRQKAAFANERNPDLFVSLHINNAPEAEWKTKSGMEVYVARDNFENSEKSKLFASAVIGSFNNRYGLPTPALPAQRQNGIWVLQAVDHPSVLIEAGYINNEKDYAYLSSEKGREAFALNLLDAINRFASAGDLSVAPIADPFSDSLGMYKGQRITRIAFSNKNNKVKLSLANRQTVWLTRSEFAKLNILMSIPPPPPPAPPVAPNEATAAVPPAPPPPPVVPEAPEPVVAPVPPPPPTPPAPPQKTGRYKSKGSVTAIKKTAPKVVSEAKYSVKLKDLEPVISIAPGSVTALIPVISLKDKN